MTQCSCGVSIAPARNGFSFIVILTSAKIRSSPSTAEPHNQMEMQKRPDEAAQGLSSAAKRMKDFFISYNKADEQWAVWVAWILEDVGYEVIIRAWDFPAGSNFVLDMNSALEETKKTIIILSNNYVKGAFTHPEWSSTMVRDPTGELSAIVPFKVGECQVPALLRAITYVDLMGLSAEDAKSAVVGAFGGRAKPRFPPPFPGTGYDDSAESSKAKKQVRFPGGSGWSIEGNITGTLYTAGNETRSNVSPRGRTSDEATQEDDRLSLAEEFSLLPQNQFNTILFVLDPPPGAIPPMPVPSAERVTALLSWAASGDGCGLEKVARVLYKARNLPARPNKPGEPYLPQPVARERVEEIKRILGRLKLSEQVVRKCYHLSSPSPRSLPDDLRMRPLEMLSYCVEILAQMACKVPYSAPLLEFLERLLPHIEAGELRDHVAQYITMVGGDLGVEIDLMRRKVAEQDAAAAVRAALEPYMLVKVEQDKDVPTMLYVVGWVLYGNEYEKLGEGSFQQNELPAFLDKLINNCEDFLDSLAGADDGTPSRPTIEVFLPVDLLDCELDRWDVSAAGVNPLTCPLGILYQVVVRSWERTYDAGYRRAKRPWREKWRARPRSLSEMTETHVCWALSGDELEEKQLLAKLLASGHVFLTLAPICGGAHDAAMVFKSMLAAGTPIAIWPRKEPADILAAREEMHALVYRHELDALPYKVYERRGAAASGGDSEDIWNFVTLMWDDPDRRPPDVGKRLTAP